MKLRSGWEDPPRRRNIYVIVALALLPVSVVIAFVIQYAMGAAAAATGGCGGG